MKNYIIVFVLTLVGVGCNKNNGNSGGNNTPVSANKDVDNYITLDGVTNYHYSYPGNATVSNGQITNQLEIAEWRNLNPSEPDYSAYVNLRQEKYTTWNDTGWIDIITLYHKVNNTLKMYGRNYITKKPLFQRNIVNGNYVYNFNNIKVYEGNGMDSTGLFKYFSGKITCNGK